MLVFSDAQFWEAFQPFTFTRPVAELRNGILSFSERWKKLLDDTQCAYITEDYLQEKYPPSGAGEVLMLMPLFIPSEKGLAQIKALKSGEALVYNHESVAARIDLSNFSLDALSAMHDIDEPLAVYTKSTDLFSLAEKAIAYDFELLTKNKTSQPLSDTVTLIGEASDVFLEEGAVAEACTLNTRTGKIYIGKDAEIMEGSLIRGSLALCEGAKINMGAKVYGPTVIGPHCKVGGELNNVVFFGYSNKGHDGFLGNSVIGEWCNLGADTNSSNLKNNYAEVKLWNFSKQTFEKTGLQFCGVMMGDHTKTAINTQLNTGTVTGVSANIFKSGFPPNWIPNFSWGGMKSDPKFSLEKCYEVAERAMVRRKVSLTENDKAILKHIFENF